MSEKRHSRRLNLRLRVRFGEKGQDFPFSGFTTNVSATGLFVSATQVLKPRTRVHLEVELPGGQPAWFEGVVMRQVLVPPGLRQVLRTGFGVRYLTGEEILREMGAAGAAPVPATGVSSPAPASAPSSLRAVTASPPRPVPSPAAPPRPGGLPLRYETATQCQAALAGELSRGGAFLWTTRAVTEGAQVRVSFDLAFNGRGLDADATVVHTSTDPAGRTGVMVRFAEPAQVVASLASLLRS